MILNDHIVLFPENPLRGKNLDTFGVRFPDMSEPYAQSFIDQAKEIAAKHQIKVHEGVYVGVTGPTFETRAEYKLIKAVGGDVVGMSTVQENIAAVHCGMKVFAISVVTDLGIREDNNVITHAEGQFIFPKSALGSCNVWSFVGVMMNRPNCKKCH